MTLCPDTGVLLSRCRSEKGASRFICEHGEESTVLLTLDRTDFHDAPGAQVYGMLVKTPAELLTEQRERGVI